jgi:hypothetical protein
LLAVILSTWLFRQSRKELFLLIERIAKPDEGIGADGPGDPLVGG